MTRILTAEEVSEWLQMSLYTVYKLAKDGKLPGRKVGERWLFREDLILEHLAGAPEPEAENASVR